jgi:hypothetical protein
MLQQNGLQSLTKICWFLLPTVPYLSTCLKKTYLSFSLIEFRPKTLYRTSSNHISQATPFLNLHTTTTCKLIITKPSAPKSVIDMNIICIFPPNFTLYSFSPSFSSNSTNAVPALHKSPLPCTILFTTPSTGLRITVSIFMLSITTSG